VLSQEGIAKLSADRLRRPVRAVALLEAAKGALVVVAGAGVLPLLHRHAQAIAEALVAHLHLNPAKHYPRILIDAAGRLQDARLVTLAAFALLYAVLRFIEAFGLWRNRRWAEWLAALSGGVYIPFEIEHLLRRPDALSVAALSINALVVAFMAYALAKH
jgi:uncharacterized membrane protein (DUF2068 family)